MRIVTWNVWFGELEREARQRALWAEIAALRPDLVCLQEVVPEHLLGPEIQAKREQGWWVSDDHILDYDVAMLSRTPVKSSERVPLPSAMGRELLVARLNTAPPLTVATVHLESTASMTELRVRQLAEIRRRLAEEEEVVLVGDMNFPAGERPEAALLAGFRDAWPLIHPEEPGFTVDSRANEMRYLVKQEHTQARIDRVLVRGERWRIAGIERIGMSSLSGDPLTFVSDHFGLCVDLVPVGGAGA